MISKFNNIDKNTSFDDELIKLNHIMKKLLVFAVLASFGLVATAQEENIRFGAKAGVNFASLGGDIEDVDGKTGFHVGAVVEIPLSDKFAFAPELLFSTQGAKSEDSFDFGGFTFTEEETTKLNYLNIPLMAKYYVAQGLSLQAGPQIGLLLSADSELEVSGGGESESEEVDIKDELKGVDFGLNFGAGYQLDMGLFFDARYNLGLSNINDEGEGEDFKIKNNVIQISVGYKF